MDTIEMKNIVEILDMIEEQLETEFFKELFPVILTDNSYKFADSTLFETGKNKIFSSIYDSLKILLSSFSTFILQFVIYFNIF